MLPDMPINLISFIRLTIGVDFFRKIMNELC